MKQTGAGDGRSARSVKLKANGVRPHPPPPIRDLTRDALGSLYFGLADARSLAAAGRIAGPADQVAALARLFATDDRAYNITGF